MTLFFIALIQGCNSPDPVYTSPKERDWGPGEHEAYIEREREHRQRVNANIQESGQQEQRQEPLSTAKVHDRAMAFIQSHTHKGSFRIQDHLTGEVVDLKLIRLIDPAIRIEGRGFHAGTQRPVGWRRTGVFTCAEFQLNNGENTTAYDLDIWLDEFETELPVSEVLIHKSPSHTGKGWTLEERFSLKAEDPITLGQVNP